MSTRRAAEEWPAKIATAHLVADYAMLIGSSLLRNVRVSATRNLPSNTLTSRAAFHVSARASRVVASQPLNAKEAVQKPDLSKGYPIVDHE